MTIGRLKEILNSLPEEINGVNIDDVKLFTRNSINPNGNISELDKVEISSYGSWGRDVPCICFNTEYDLDRYGKRINLEHIDLDNEYGIPLNYKGDSIEYKNNLALQRKISEYLFHQADDNYKFDGLVGKYYHILMPGVLTEIDFSMLMRILPEILKKPITREEFNQNRAQIIESIMASFGITDTKEPDAKTRK